MPRDPMMLQDPEMLQEPCDAPPGCCNAPGPCDAPGPAMLWEPMMLHTPLYSGILRCSFITLRCYEALSGSLLPSFSLLTSFSRGLSHHGPKVPATSASHRAGMSKELCHSVIPQSCWEVGSRREFVSLPPRIYYPPKTDPVSILGYRSKVVL